MGQERKGRGGAEVIVKYPMGIVNRHQDRNTIIHQQKLRNLIKENNNVNKVNEHSVETIIIKKNVNAKVEGTGEWYTSLLKFLYQGNQY